MKKIRDNGLSLVLVAAFILFWIGQAVAGYFENNHDQKMHRQPTESFSHYLGGSHFWEATFENWESEFLQMSAYVLLTVFLFQRGSAESKDPEGDEGADKTTNRTGLRAKLYEHSLSLTLGSFFVLCWLGHAIAGSRQYNQDLVSHGLPPVKFTDFLTSARFWFESFQNWQSEFLAVAAIVILSIWLREKGSPESKSMNAAHSDTGR